MRFIEGTQHDDAYGVLFRRADPHHYAFVIGVAQQLYSLHNEDEVLTGWQYSPYVNPGNDVNTIGVLCDGDRITLFVNGQRVDSIQDNRSLLGTISLSFANNEHIAFDYIRVSALAR